MTVEEDITKHFLREMSEGVYLKELERTTKPCIIFQEENIPVVQRKRQFHIILTEGLKKGAHYGSNSGRAKARRISGDSERRAGAGVNATLLL